MSIRAKRSLQTRILQYLSTLICVTFFSGAIFAAPAESFWGASATTAVPQTFKNSNSTSYTILGTKYGSGVGSAAEPSCTSGDIFNCEFGISRLFIPVTAKLGEKFSGIWLRAYDDARFGHVTATLYRQYLGEQAATQIARISTTSQGFEIVHDGIIDPNNNNTYITISEKYTYYIEVKIIKSKPEFAFDDIDSLIVFDVGLGKLDDRCLYEKEWEYKSCIITSSI